MKFKPVYTVYLDEQVIGYVENKNEFEKLLEQNLYNNFDENIAFSDINAEVKYESKLINKEEETQEEQILLAIKEKSDITYFQYAINVDGVDREYVKSQEEANTIAESLRQELGEEINVAVTTVYTKQLDVVSSQELASVAENLELTIKEEKEEEARKEASTINGVYLAVNPVVGNISSRYGARESIRDHTHKGIDIAATRGTPILATASGTVTFAGWSSGYGYLVKINHGNGVETYYGHCSKLYVSAGDTVEAGEQIAAVGSTGNSTGNHLHFEIRLDGKQVNPQTYVYQ